MNEFPLIQKYFVPLSKQFKGSLALSDDAALLDIPAGFQLAVTKDAIAQGVHFIGTEDPALIARKLLRTNLSDLAAMGAQPLCYFLSLALPKPLSEDYIARFAAGLAEDQEIFSIHLAGGDTIATHGTPIFSITAHGLVPQGKALRRNGARAGDAIYVSGTLGDAALGLGRAQDPAIPSHDALVQRYLLPQPRLELGRQLRGRATSCIDISDGLLQDLSHVCTASHTGAEIHVEQLPISAAARELLNTSPQLMSLIYSGGDDYELLFTLPAGVAAPEHTTHIGTITDTPSVRLLSQGVEISAAQKGYAH